MDSFISRKKRKTYHPGNDQLPHVATHVVAANSGDNDDTDTKLAILASLYPELDQIILFEALIAADGSVTTACQNLTGSVLPPPEASPSKHRTISPAKPRTIGLQTPLPFASTSAARSLTRKGQTLHLYTPSSIAQHTPCSLVPNFLPPDLADSLLKELLTEANTFSRATFKLFDNVVTSPHSACFYVSSEAEAAIQTTDYLYNGSVLDDVRQLTPYMRDVQELVKQAVNEEIAKRIKEWYPGGQKLRFQSKEAWEPNAAFVNSYAGGAESVGWHTDQLTYLGPRAVIGSISLGVAREFRVRKIVPKDEVEAETSDEMAGKPGNDKDTKATRKQADEQGQIAIHLPHNSLLVMHAEMQEEWKHSIAPTQAIDPHPVAGNRRINITYRHYRADFNPKFTPRCKCGVATVLRCVQKQKVNRGRYMWQCHAGNAPGKEGCNFFRWAEFNDDGRPPWGQSMKMTGDTTTEQT